MGISNAHSIGLNGARVGGAGVYRLGLFENVAASMPKVSSIQTAQDGAHKSAALLGAAGFAMRHIAKNEKRHEQRRTNTRIAYPPSFFRKQVVANGHGHLISATSFGKFERGTIEYQS